MSVPVTVIGGYLGAGKTTLVNHVLRSANGIRFAVLVNDFGALNIDAELIVAADGDTLELANGCVCCSLAGGFAEALFSLRERAVRPDHVLVEASGVADPAAAAQYAHLDGFRLDGIVVLADAEQVRARARDRYVGKHVLAQLRSADLVVITKPDLVDADRLAALHRWIGERAPGRPIVHSVHGDVPIAALFDVETSPHPPGDAHVDHRTWTWTADEPIDRAQLDALIGDLDDDVVRAKGFVHLAEAPGNRFVLQVVGRRSTLTADGPWPGPPATRLVFIQLPRLQETP